MVYLSYDGSINGDWISKYAIRMAALKNQPVMHVVHVLDGQMNSALLSEKLEALQKESEKHGVKCEVDLYPLKGSVLKTILENYQPTDEDVLVCGTRARSRKGFLGGTISEALLNSGHNVIALKVVHPGRMGASSDYLLPLAMKGHCDPDGLLFLKYVEPALESIHTVHIEEVSSLFYRYLSRKRVVAITHRANTRMNQAIEYIRQSLPNFKGRLDSSVVISNDMAKEIIIQANQYKVNMIVMGMPTDRLGRFFYGSRIEEIMRKSSADVAVCSKR